MRNKCKVKKIEIEKLRSIRRKMFLKGNGNKQLEQQRKKKAFLKAWKNPPAADEEE